MVYQVTIEETYRYTKRIDCCDETELSRIVHEEIPLIADMEKEEVEDLRQQGMQLRCAYSW